MSRQHQRIRVLRTCHHASEPNSRMWLYRTCCRMAGKPKTEMETEKVAQRAEAVAAKCLALDRNAQCSHHVISCVFCVQCVRVLLGNGCRKGGL